MKDRGEVCEGTQIEKEGLEMSSGMLGTGKRQSTNAAKQRVYIIGQVYKRRITSEGRTAAIPSPPLNLLPFLPFSDPPPLSLSPISI